MFIDLSRIFRLIPRQRLKPGHFDEEGCDGLPYEQCIVPGCPELNRDTRNRWLIQTFL